MKQIMRKIQIVVVGLIFLGILFFIPSMAVSAQGNQSLAPLITISSDQIKFTTGEEVIIDLTITNPHNTAIKILNWVLPADEMLNEPVFQITVNGTKIPYIGRLYKRPPPTANDYLVIPAKETVTMRVNLSAAYAFAESGNYSIVYQAVTPYLYDEQIDAVGTLSSNTLELDVEARIVPLQTIAPVVGVSGSTTYASCTTTQKNQLVTARANASTYAELANEYMQSGAKGTRYTTWFGAYTSVRYNNVKSNTGAILTAVDTAPIKFDCGCKDNYYAWVYPGVPYEIHLCNAFWTSPAVGTDSKPGVIIHEISHFTIVSNTDDHVYGKNGSKNLANTNPAKAINNADNFEFFYENTPALECTSVGVPSRTSPANNATLSDTTPTLDWSSVAGSSGYQFQLYNANKSTRLMNVSRTASSYTTPTLSDGTYHWRVRSQGSPGCVDGQWSAYWSFTIAAGTVAKPGAFNKSTPSNGATNQSISPTLSWTASSGASSYAYCIDKTNDNACSSWVNNGSSRNVSLSGLDYNAKYYWHARAINSGGTTYANGSTTAYGSFTTQNAPTSKPGAFNKSAPSNGATNQSINSTLSWAASTGASSYAYCIDKTNDNACSGWINKGTTRTVSLSGLDNNTKYYWHVRATNTSGTTYANGSATAHWSFTTIAAPSGDGDSYEPDNTKADATLIASGATQNHSLAPANDVDWYKIVIAETSAIKLETSGASGGDTRMWLYNSSLAQVKFDDDGGAGTYSLINRTCGSQELNAGTYYVKVDEYYAEVLSAYTLSFDIVETCGTSGGETIGVPANLQATDGTYTNKIRVSWNAVSGATSYTVQRYTGSSWVTVNTTGNRYYNDSSATPLTTYKYRVKACGASGCSGYSSMDTGYRAKLVTKQLVRNGGFEADSNNDGLPNAWVRRTNNGQDKRVCSSAVKYAGNCGYRFLGDSVTRKDFVRQTLTNKFLTASDGAGVNGDKLILSFWARSIGVDANDGSYALVKIRNSATGQKQTIKVPISGTFTYKKFTKTLTTNIGAYDQVWVYFFFNGDAAENLYVDGVSVRLRYIQLKE